MQKKILVLNASHIEELNINILKNLGCYVITTGNRPDFPAHKLADQYINADYSDKEIILKIAQDYNIDAICPNGNDFGVETAAYVSEKLGLSGHDSYQSTMILHNKDKFKKYARKVGIINTPEALSFDNEHDALIWAESNEYFPLIIKPVDFFGGRGINKATNRISLFENIKYAFTKSKSQRIIVEPFLIGHLCSICTFLHNKKVIVACTDNEFCFSNPYRVECSCFPASEVDNLAGLALIPQIEFMAKDLELTDGIFHVQYIVNNGKAYIIECMRRILGNLFSVAASESTEGFDWYYWQTRAKCGFECKDIPLNIVQNRLTSYKVIRADRTGTIEHLIIPEEWTQYIKSTKRLIKDGEKISDCESDVVAILQLSFDHKNQMYEYMINRKDDVVVALKQTI